MRVEKSEGLRGSEGAAGGAAVCTLLDGNDADDCSGFSKTRVPCTVMTTLFDCRHHLQCTAEAGSTETAYARLPIVTGHDFEAVYRAAADNSNLKATLMKAGHTSVTKMLLQ